VTAEGFDVKILEAKSQPDNMPTTGEVEDLVARMERPRRPGQANLFSISRTTSSSQLEGY